MLPEFVDDDSDLPGPLNTAAKQEKWAKTLAAAHTGKKAQRVQAPDMQGSFSRTRVVSLVGGDKVVIQFRILPLEIECFQKARGAFGQVIPEVTQLHDEELEALGLSIYAMTYMPGRCWLHVQSSEGAVVVDDYILPCLTQFRDSIKNTTKPLEPHVDRLIAACQGIKKLPLYVSHHDLNDMNVLIGDNDEVSGIVDWECARDLPFGMGFHRITDTIVANNSGGEFQFPEGWKEAEKEFWDAVLSNASSTVLENLDDIQNALHLGALVFAIKEKFLEGPDPDTNFICGVLSYRLPQLRGNGDPFAPDYM